MAARKLEKEECRLDPLKDSLKEAKQRKAEKVNTVSNELEEIDRRHQDNE